MIDTELITIGHRGLAGLAPENTLAGIRTAFDRGIQWIEVDVQRTKDGELVLLHDLSVNRTTNGKGRLTNLPWAEVQALDAGAHFSRSFAGEKIPLLRDALALVKSAGGILIIEVKSPGRYPGIGAEIDWVIQAGDAAENVLLMSFDISFLNQMAAAKPACPLGGLYLWPPKTTPDYMRYISVYWRSGFLFPKRLSGLRAKGVRTWAWTVNRPEDKASVIKMGFQGLVTDFP